MRLAAIEEGIPNGKYWITKKQMKKITAGLKKKAQQSESDEEHWVDIKKMSAAVSREEFDEFKVTVTTRLDNTDTSMAKLEKTADETNKTVSQIAEMFMEDRKERKAASEGGAWSSWQQGGKGNQGNQGYGKGGKGGYGSFARQPFVKGDPKDAPPPGFTKSGRPLICQVCKEAGKTEDQCTGHTNCKWCWAHPSLHTPEFCPATNRGESKGKSEIPGVSRSQETHDSNTTVQDGQDNSVSETVSVKSCLQLVNGCTEAVANAIAGLSQQQKALPPILIMCEDAISNVMSVAPNRVQSFPIEPVLIQHDQAISHVRAHAISLNKMSTSMGSTAVGPVPAETVALGTLLDPDSIKETPMLSAGLQVQKHRSKRHSLDIIMEEEFGSQPPFQPDCDVTVTPQVGEGLLPPTLEEQADEDQQDLSRAPLPEDECTHKVTLTCCPNNAHRLDP